MLNSTKKLVTLPEGQNQRFLFSVTLLYKNVPPI